MNIYAPSIEGNLRISANHAALLALGCSDVQASQFADKPFVSLPAWLRNRIKATTRVKNQSEPRYLRPRAGQIAFYVNSARFPQQKKPVTAVASATVPPAASSAVPELKVTKSVKNRYFHRRRSMNRKPAPVAA